MSFFRIDMEGDELHAKLGGGLPQNAILLIEAENAVGKSVLAQRFAYGVLNHDYSATYISSELALIGFMKQMSSLGYDIKGRLLSKKLKFVSLFPAMGKVEFRANMIDMLLRKRTLFDSNVIVIDTLSELLVKDEMTLKDCYDLLGFFRRIATQEKTIIFCVDQTTLSKKFLEMLRTVADVYIRMEVREQFGNLLKVMKVERFNGAPAEVTEEIPFKVKAGIGIVPELASSS